ncbi:M13 family metallopeptidase [Granulicella cerasi]|uniref:M13 family metallopeptidase n=1 Tax=Granulicella cerasi TaxID=741063 RepID=A0ABW1Z7J9_9BACT|nr:M13 family metallopeptidase [Granulicella cerasi]
MRFLAVASLLAVSALPVLAQAPASSAKPVAPKKPVLLDINGIDKTADPCSDFYQYACGNWRKNNPLPSDKTRYGRFNELHDYNLYSLYTEVTKASESPNGPVQKQYGDYFAACMNTTKIDELGIKPIKPAFAKIDELKDIKGLTALDVDFFAHRGGGFFFNVGVQQDQKDSSQQILGTGQGGLSLPDRDYYLNDDDRSKTLRAKYVEHMKKMFVLAGDTPEQAAVEADSVLRIETALAKGSMARVEMRDPAKRYHIMTIAEVEQLSPVFDWQQYIAGIGVAQAKTLNVSSPGYVTTVQQVLTAEQLSAVKSYMRWHTLHRAASALSKPFEDEDFDFFHRTLAGQKEPEPRWKRCTQGTDMALGEAVGQDWVKTYFPPQAKDRMEKLIKALEASMAVDLQNLEWMSPETKVEARKKLDAIADKIGYPEHWKDYSSITVKRDDFIGNGERISLFETRRNLNKFGKPVDPTEWGMTPPTVNAYYSPSQNNINFPAGILQPPFYDPSLDAAANFGGIGVVIGHEMTHGFDDQGAKYDLKGNVRQWWTDEDKKKFETRTGCVADEYSSFQVAEGQNLNGRLTLGENTADNGGLRISFQAMEKTIKDNPKTALPGYVDGKRDGYTPEQRFFLAFGQVWCENSTEQSRRVAAKTDPHSAGQYRTNGSVQNFDEFGKAFGCKVGSPMRPANGGCRVW